ncbi:Hypothetical protein LUCI_2443 [Lucifera butyrica]|uniref:DUF5666 domain-containing protein n=1 Tax=Lucifera butyrica TaxID=1351585 RepID=A0A498R7K1_9FIRM|nr:hypothetical protein [Lucifera butyrica]VBB07199.1 Hypothetical protein LUCI_2443 [Lucifera butyrica]
MKLVQKTIVLSLVAILCLGLSTTYATSTKSINFKGTIRHVMVEGDFWGIISEDGKKYEPTNLKEEFKQDGLPVQVKATVTNRFNIHMWGKTIEIIKINRIKNSQ